VLGSDPAVAYLEFGAVFLAAKRDDLAIKAFRRGLVYEPDHPQLTLLLAQTLLRTGQGEQALALVEHYIKLQPLGNDSYELLAKILTALHREAEITPRLEEAAKADSKNVPLQYALADRYRETGQVEKAEQMYKELLAAQPTTQAYGALAASLFKRKKTEDLLRVMTEALSKPGGPEAIAAIAPQLEAITRDPAYADEVLDAGLKMLSADPPALDPKTALIILTHIASRTEKFEKLVALQRILLKQNPSPLAYREIADSLFRMKKYAEAAATLDELIARYPDEKNPNLLVLLAGIRRMADLPEAALEAAREALKLDPTDSGAQVLLIQLLSQTGKLDEAVEIARNALKDDPANPDFNRLLGYILTQFGRTDEAIALYRGLLERYPNKTEIVHLARSGLSVAYINLGEYAKGEAELEALLDLDPNESGVNNDLGYLYADQGKNLEKAEAMIRKAIQDDPDNPAYLDSLGWVLFKRGRVKEAVDPLEKAVENPSGGGDATIFEHLGDVYFQLQETQKARTAWEQAEKAAAKAVPQDRRLPEIRKKLESLDKLGTTPKPKADDAP
jgi:Tfp pilus assembly protein PilF